MMNVDATDTDAVLPIALDSVKLATVVRGTTELAEVRRF
jgi:hypothetical protein